MYIHISNYICWLLQLYYMRIVSRGCLTKINKLQVQFESPCFAASYISTNPESHFNNLCLKFLTLLLIQDVFNILVSDNLHIDVFLQLSIQEHLLSNLILFSILNIINLILHHNSNDHMAMHDPYQQNVRFTNVDETLYE